MATPIEQFSAACKLCGAKCSDDDKQLTDLAIVAYRTKDRFIGARSTIVEDIRYAHFSQGIHTSTSPDVDVFELYKQIRGPKKNQPSKDAYDRAIEDRADGAQSNYDIFIDALVIYKVSNTFANNKYRRMLNLHYDSKEERAAVRKQYEKTKVAKIRQAIEDEAEETESTEGEESPSNRFSVDLKETITQKKNSILSKIVVILAQQSIDALAKKLETYENKIRQKKSASQSSQSSSSQLPKRSKTSK